MEGPPESYLDARRPPLQEALQLEETEGAEDAGAALRRLTEKGYFTPPPRPWSLGYNDRGMDRLDWAVLDRFGDLVVKTEDRVTAELIIAAVNGYTPSGAPPE